MYDLNVRVKTYFMVFTLVLVTKRTVFDTPTHEELVSVVC